MDTKNFALRLPAEQYNKIGNISSSMGISRNALMVIALQKYILQVEKSKRKAKDKDTIAHQLKTARSELLKLENRYKKAQNENK